MSHVTFVTGILLGANFIKLSSRKYCLNISLRSIKWVGHQSQQCRLYGVLADNLFLLSKIFCTEQVFCAYRLHDIGPCLIGERIPFSIDHKPVVISRGFYRVRWWHVRFFRLESLSLTGVVETVSYLSEPLLHDEITWFWSCNQCWNLFLKKQLGGVGLIVDWSCTPLYLCLGLDWAYMQPGPCVWVCRALQWALSMESAGHGTDEERSCERSHWLVHQGRRPFNLHWGRWCINCIR